ncbi:PAS domain S-box protein [Azohydromonas caseinilytica]|uniref:histidine kinase n=1 Tax=Azohydromonas caseinilytica TaxID=2728836 RepID=A0A848FEN0_9BURK|nr:PAS domain S-box protein [Azohydromonas caseinilytica]NML17868.1 PAS domain S-box protein [Azohydromonas caseinilytica]
MSCDRFRSLADILPNLVFEADARGANLWASAGWERYSGLTAQQMAERGWYQTVHPEDLAAAQAQWTQRIAAGVEFSSRRRIRRRDGQWRWHLVHVVPRHDAAGTLVGWVGSATDVDEMVRAEQALAEQEQRARFLLGLSEGLRDLANPQEQMDAATAALGAQLAVAQVGYGEIDGSPACITVHRDWNDGRIPSVVGTWRLPDFGPAYLDDIEAGRTVAIPDVARDPRTSAPEVVAAYAGIHTRSILDVPLVKHGRLVALLFIHHPEPRQWTPTDIALAEQVCERLWAAVERARAERARDASEAHLSAVLDALPVGVAITDAQGRTLRDNAALRALWGMPPNADRWAQYGDWVGWHADTGQRIQAHEGGLARSLLHGEVVRGELVQCQPFDGGPRRFLLNNTAPVLDAQGRFLGGVAVVIDVTAQRAAEMEREKLLAAETLARERIEQLQGLTATLSAARTPQQVAMATLQAGVRSIGASQGSVYRLIDGARAGDTAELLAAVGYDEAVVRAWRRIPADLATPAGDAMAQRRPVVIGSGAELVARYPGLSELVETSNYRGTATFPLLLSAALNAPGGREAAVLGFVSFDFDHDHAVSEAELGYLGTLAQLCAQALERARMYEAEHAARAQVESMLAAISDAFFALDRDWRFTYVNDRALAVTGSTREEVLGHVVWDAFPDIVGTVFEHLYRHAMTQGVPVAFEAFYPRLGVWMEVRVYPGPQGLGVYFQDVTARREAEERLRASEDLLRAIFEAAPVGLAFAEAPDGRIVKANRQLESILGHPVLEGHGVQDYGDYTAFHPDGRRVQAREHVLARALAGEERPEMELLYHRPDGRQAWVRAVATPLRHGSGTVTGALMVLDDIDQQRRASEALQERTQQLAQARLRLDMALTAGRMGVWDWIVPTGEAYWNRQMYELLGLPVREDGAGQGEVFNAMVHPEDRPAYDQKLARALSDGSIFEMEFRLLRLDGQLRWVLGRGQAMLDEDGQVLRMAGVSLDITAQKTAQLALARALQDKDLLLYEVHHRVKNNLQVINSLLSLQLRSVTDPQGRRAIEEAAARVGVMARLHQELYRSDRHGMLDLAHWLRRLALDTLRLLDGDRRIALDFEADAGLLLGADQVVPLSLAVSELLTNAVKYAFPPGRTGTVRLRVHRHAQELRVLVADDGVGLPADFDLEASSGLGMRIIHALVRQIDARLQVLERRAGAAFCLDMPLPAPAAG